MSRLTPPAQELPHLWNAIAMALGTLLTNWGWSRIAGNYWGSELFVLVLASFLFWPLSMVILSSIMMAILRKLSNPLRLVVVLGTVLLGVMVFGVPPFLNLSITAIVGIAALFHFGRLEHGGGLEER